MRPVVEKIKEDFGGRINVVVVDVATASGERLAGEYTIEAIPTFIMFDSKGKMVDKYVGVISHQDLSAVIEKL